jgi:hypothetical protein
MIGTTMLTLLPSFLVATDLSAFSERTGPKDGTTSDGRPQRKVRGGIETSRAW